METSPVNGGAPQPRWHREPYHAQGVPYSFHAVFKTGIVDVGAYVEKAVAMVLRGTLAAPLTRAWRGAIVLLPVDHIALDAQGTIWVRRQQGDMDILIKWLFPRDPLATVGGDTLSYSPSTVI
ncbi:MAG: hypothetical protein KAX23_05065 [Dehalococcoidia bacterium]|jgi:hypothetical protein|nr:hypothetical protein [Chloroflexota bacterium]MCK4242899.1 hypothetical protein [Dehalococcoidia bacterium]